MPRNLQVVPEPDAFLAVAGHRCPAQFDHDDGDEPELAILWSDVEERELNSDATTRCLWAFAKLADDTMARLPAFVRQWGLLDAFGESPATPGEPGHQSVRDWHDAAQEVRNLLTGIAITEEGEDVPETLLWDLRGGDRRDYTDMAQQLRDDTKVSWPEFHIRGERQRLRFYRDERRAGRGPALQRELIVNLLGMLPIPPEWRNWDAPHEVPATFAYAWDGRGRRIEAHASGVREIVASHLLLMFGSPELDLFVCSVCGNPYSLETAQMARRPRAGVKKLCSDACRKEARRESNRSSWNKNKDRWRPSAVRTTGDQATPNL